MRQAKCALCGEGRPQLLEYHHVKPKVLGGTDDETNILTLCGKCHGIFHEYLRPISLGTLIREGQILSNQRPVLEKINSIRYKMQVVQNELDVLNVEYQWALERVRGSASGFSTASAVGMSIVSATGTATSTGEATALVINDTPITQEEEEMPRLRPIKDSTSKKDEAIQIPNTEHLTNREVRRIIAAVNSIAVVISKLTNFSDELTNAIEMLAMTCDNALQRNEGEQTSTTVDTKNKDGYWGPLLTQMEFHCATLGTRK